VSSEVIRDSCPTSGQSPCKPGVQCRTRTISLFAISKGNGDIGPNIEIWGTPTAIGRISDFISSISTHCVLLLR